MNNNEKEPYTEPLTPSLPSSPSPPSPSSENTMTVPRWQLPPELAIMIARYLTRAEKSRCVCVSDMWSTIWSPILWQSIVLGKRRCTLFKHTLETPTFLRNRFFIHTCRAAFGLALGSLLLAADCQQLRALELWFEVAPSDDAVANILAYAETLPAAAAFPHVSPSDVVLGLLNNNTGMKELSITGDFEHLVGPDQQDAAPAVPMTNILSFIQADNLESLSIEFQQMSQSKYGKSWKKVTTHLPRLRCLKVLRFTGSETSLIEFVTRCPALVSLKVQRDFSYDPVINGELIWDSCNALQYIGVTLKALKELVWEVDGDDDVCNDMLQNIFLINPGLLTKINIRAPSTSCSLLAREAMLRAAASIEELTLDGVAGLLSTQIQEFLQQATNLKVFKILTLSRSYDSVVDRPLCWWHLYDPEGDNDDETRPWACEQTLERLAVVIQVSNEARLDVGVNPKPVMTEVEKDIHKRVYSQLNRLIKLRELVLSGETTNEHRDLDKMHTECLALSLESGLDMLHDMQEMEVLDVRNCAHRIGVKELDWMHEHWPKMKTIKGLTESRAWADRAAQRDLVMIKRWKADHPRGIGSSFD